MFLAKLEVEKNSYNMLECRVKFQQPTDYIGKPTAKPKGGRIIIVVETNGDNLLSDWAMSENMRKGGTITFFRRDAMSKLKEITFSNAYCVEYEETFFYTGEMPMKTQIVISAESIKVGGTKLSNNWPGLA